MSSMFARLLSIIASVALVAVPGARVSAQSDSSLSGQLGQLKSAAASSGDATLKSLGSDLGSKVQALNKSLAGNPDTQGQLSGALQSLLGNKGGESLAACQKLSQAKLTDTDKNLVFGAPACTWRRAGDTYYAFRAG